MYKVKIVFLLERSDGTTMWSEQWVDWDGQLEEELDCIVSELREKEEKALKEDNMDETVKYAIAVETVDITDGKYQCGSCECYFNETNDGDCPFCGSGNFVEGCIDG